MADITIRALMQIDNLQPKFAAYNGATVQGSVPLSGDTVLIGEFAPGNGVFKLIDRALKASRVEVTTQLVEREFGFFILRSPSNGEVSTARDAILAELGRSMADRRKPQVTTTQAITGVEPYQAQLLNKWRKGWFDDYDYRAKRSFRHDPGGTSLHSGIRDCSCARHC